MKDLNILIVGVGGQGTLLSSRFLGAAALMNGKEVKVSEVHGMSQRGGSVVTCVKIGDQVASPIIDLGEADVILAFEQLEAIRWLSYLKPRGTVILNTQKINPMPVISGKAAYPEEILSVLQHSDIRVVALDALQLAEKCGTAKAVNVVLLGVLASMLPDVPADMWTDCLRSVIPPKLQAVNEKAFSAGMALQAEKDDCVSANS